MNEHVNESEMSAAEEIKSFLSRRSERQLLEHGQARSTVQRKVETNKQVSAENRENCEVLEGP